MSNSNWSPDDRSNTDEPTGQFDVRIGVDDVYVAPATMTGYDPGGHTPDPGPDGPTDQVPDVPEER